MSFRKFTNRNAVIELFVKMSAVNIVISRNIRYQKMVFIFERKHFEGAVQNKIKASVVAYDSRH